MGKRRNQDIRSWLKENGLPRASLLVAMHSMKRMSSASVQSGGVEAAAPVGVLLKVGIDMGSDTQAGREVSPARDVACRAALGSLPPSKKAGESQGMAAGLMPLNRVAALQSALLNGVVWFGLSVFVALAAGASFALGVVFRAASGELAASST